MDTSLTHKIIAIKKPTEVGFLILCVVIRYRFDPAHQQMLWQSHQYFAEW